MKHKNLMIDRFTSQWNTLFEYFNFCLEKLIFMRHLCRNPQFLGIFISIRHIWSSCWQDKCQIRLSLQRCQPLETLNRPPAPRLSFFHYPLPGIFNEPPPPLPRKIDPAPNGNGLGHYMTSYMIHILSKFEIIVFMLQIIFVSDLKYVQKCPRNRTANKKNSSFELKMGYISN